MLEIQGVKISVLVCEDAWHPEPAAHLKSLGAQLLLVTNASPFHTEKVAKRLRFFGARVQETGLPILSINRVGGQDELIFDGASFALQKDNTLAIQLPMFVSVLHEAVFDIAEQAWHKDMVIETPCEEEEAYRAMVMGVRVAAQNIAVQPVQPVQPLQPDLSPTSNRRRNPLPMYSEMVRRAPVMDWVVRTVAACKTAKGRIGVANVVIRRNGSSVPKGTSKRQSVQSRV